MTPPCASMGEGVRVLVYDGACGLCTRSIAFVARHDRRRRFAFVPRDDAAAVAAFGTPLPTLPGPGSVVLVDADGRVFTRSTAVLRAARALDFPWNLLAAGLLVPRAIRDALYDVVARHRHRFGAPVSCPLPPPRDPPRAEPR